MRFLRPYSEHLFTVLRIVAGLMFACHGVQKLFGGLGGTKVHEPLMIAAGVIELVCGLMIATGFLGGIAAFLASGEMAAAYFKAHFPSGGLPIQNKGELAVLYCFLFLYIAGRGSGFWSIDGLIGRSKEAGSKTRGVDRDH